MLLWTKCWASSISCWWRKQKIYAFQTIPALKPWTSYQEEEACPPAWGLWAISASRLPRPWGFRNQEVPDSNHNGACFSHGLCAQTLNQLKSHLLGWHPFSGSPLPFPEGAIGCKAWPHSGSVWAQCPSAATTQTPLTALPWALLPSTAMEWAVPTTSQITRRHDQLIHL